MRWCKTAAGVWLAACLAAPLHRSGEARGETVVCEGVLGNSGESGETLVRFSPRGVRGMGVAYDRAGSLWDRAGRGRLNRYAPDGRLLAQYRIPDRDGRRDKITLAGDRALLLVGDQVYALDVDAPPGSEAKPLGVRAEHMSFGSCKGRLAFVDREKRLFLLDPSTADGQAGAAGAREDVTTLRLPNIEAVEMDEEGAIYVQEGWKMHRLVDGRPAGDGWPRSVPGERSQLLPPRPDGFWFGHSWHGTIKRFDRDLQPAPGVVQGGASGSFIGHLAQNSELINGRGMAHLGGNLYAVSGIGCVMHLLEWRAGERRLEIVRRIGALPRVPGLGLDRRGRVFCINGQWNWDDRPDTPQRFGTTADVCGQVVMLDNDCVAAPGVQYGNQPRVLQGPLSAEVMVSGYKQVEFIEGVREKGVGAAVCRRKGRLVLLIATVDGRGQAIEIDSSGRFRANAGDVALRTASPVSKLTTLAMKGPDTLLAAADGQVIEMARDGDDWKETRRWNSWGAPPQGGAGPDEKLGGEIWITSDDGRLWVSDTARHRVVCLEIETGRPVATFGRADEPGTDLGSLSEPRAVAARGRRAVVFDAGNQRLVKLALRP